MRALRGLGGMGCAVCLVFSSTVGLCFACLAEGLKTWSCWKMPDQVHLIAPYKKSVLNWPEKQILWSIQRGGSRKSCSLFILLSLDICNLPRQPLVPGPGFLQLWLSHPRKNVAQSSLKLGVCRILHYPLTMSRLLEKTLEPICV